MKLYRDKNFRKEIAGSLVLTLTVSGAAFFSSTQAGIYTAAGMLALSAVHFFFVARRYRDIARLGQYLNEILHGQSAVLIEDGKEGELAVLRSEIRKMTVRLKAQTDELIREKSTLGNAVNDIFHQLRGPLTSMHLMIAMLGKQGTSPEKRTELIHEIKKQLIRMQWLVETLLHMSRFDAGTAEMRTETVSVETLIKKACSPFEIQMELRGQTLITVIDADTLVCDPAWTIEALSNLIKNAVEHTPSGGTITVAARDTALFTEIAVSNTGKGICREDLPYIFKRFYKGKNASEGSIGIGLAFCRMIIHRQNGTVTAENMPDGARFIVKFYKSVV